MGKKILVSTLLWLCVCSAALAAVPRGVIIDDTAGNYILLRDGAQMPCQKGEFLYDGDIIAGDNVGGLAIQWHPYAKGERISGDKLQVRYEEPGTLDVALYKVKEFLGLVDTEVTVQYGATRGETKATKNAIHPLPGFSATVMPDEKVIFAWGDTYGKNLIIRNSKNKVVKSIKISGQNKAELSVEELGLTPWETYTWQVEGLYEQHKLRLLDEKTVVKVTCDLKKIEETAASENEVFLQKALYLQLASDAKPSDVDLYWLSYQMLLKVNPGEDALLTARVERAKKNVIEHISGMR